MRNRSSRGGVTKQRGKWRGRWYENGVKKSATLGLVSEMSKGEARQAVAKIIGQQRASQDGTLFGPFVEGVLFPFYRRKWKDSTRAENEQRIRFHLVSIYKDRELGSFRRDELQDLLDAKAKEQKLSFSVVAHLRFDLRQIFGMAVAEGNIERNPAVLLFIPKEAKRPVRRVTSIDDVQRSFAVLGQRERLIARLAILGGMRPSEIFGLRWPMLGADYADIQRRIYRGREDTPKTEQSYRKAALADGLIAEIEDWRKLAVDLNGWVFPSERLTALSKDNVWRRNMLSKLKEVGLEWCNFQVMRRSHATLMRQLKADPHMVAAQLGHSVEVSLNTYAQAPVEVRLPLVNELERLVVN
jgi:integrase